MAGAQVPISGNPASTTIASSDLLQAVIGGTTKKITAGNLRSQFFAFAATDSLNCGAITAVGASSITGALTGVTSFGATSIASSGAIQVTGGASTAGAIWKSASAGMVVQSVAGSSFDYFLGNPAATAIMTVPTGTLNVAFAGTIALSLAGSQIIGGATSLSLRNNANNADNILISDAGAITLRGSVTGVTTLNTSGLVTAGGGVNIGVGSFAAGNIYQSASSGLNIALLTGSSFDLNILNPAGSVGLLRVSTGTTDFVFGGGIRLSPAASKIMPGATNLSLRNNADGADNLLITDAGAVTIRAGLVVTAGNIAATAGNLTFGAASAKIIPGATSLLFRNNGDSANNFAITDAGIITTRGGLSITAAGALGLVQGGTAQPSLNMPAGVAPTSPTDGDMWYDGTNIKFRVGVTTRTFTVT